MARVFDGCYEAWNYICNNDKREQLTDYEFELAFQQAISHYSLIDILRKGWYRTEQQRQILINRFVHDIQHAGRFMNEVELQNQLNYKQYQTVHELALLNSEYCSSVMLDDNKRYHLSKEERQKMLKTLVANSRLESLWNKNITTVQEDEWILTEHQFSYNTYKSYLEYTIRYEDKYPLRSIAFQYVKNNSDDCYNLAQADKLTDMEKTIVHDLYGAELSKGRTWEKYWTYCKAFKNCLSKKEQERLVKKLQDRRYIQYVRQVQQAFKLDEKWQQVLQGIMIADRLRGKVG